MLGLDEAGCGPAFGNLVACAVHIPDGVTIDGLADSKKLSEKKRNVLFEHIVKHAMYGIGQVTNEEIDTHGLGEARRVVFERALDDFSEKYKDFDIKNLVIDGTIFRQWHDIPYECIPKADDKYSEVSAASIVAKVTRDRQIISLCEEDCTLDEYYGIKRNKGYLSKEHINGIRKHGKCKHHRYSYKIRI